MSPGKGLNRRIESSLADLIQSGFSLSGREPNCCFLNLGNGRFADVSHVSGFGFDDDARAIGLTDWDFDGDLDLWVVNRNGPMLRLLRNDLPPGKHFLKLRLRGTLCNRDAIGARVELYLPGQKVPLLRTLRAGEGFLSQSSKWLHFGLGEHDRVEKIVVRWPHGQAETFTVPDVDRHYLLVQGAGRAEPWSPPTSRQAKLARSPLPRPKAKTPPRVIFSHRLGLPELPYRTDRGRLTSWDRLRGRPALVVLWASWCQPCVRELQSLKKHHPRLRDQGLRVLALCVDGVLGDGQAAAEALRQARGEWKLPFELGEATSQTVERLQQFLDTVFVRREQLAVPTSFLLDRQGKLVVLYRGAVDPKQLEQDIQLLEQPREQLARAAFPFPGRWVEEPDFVVEAHYAKALVDEQKTEQAARYVRRHKKRIAQSPFFQKLIVMIGDQFAAKGQFDRALPWLEEAARIDDSLVETHLLLGFCYASLKDFRRAVAAYRRALRLEPNRPSALKNLGWLLLISPDPLVQNRSEALQLLKKAVELAPEDASAWEMLFQAYALLRQPARAVETLQRAARAMEENNQLEAATKFRTLARQIQAQRQQRSGK